MRNRSAPSPHAPKVGIALGRGSSFSAGFTPFEPPNSPSFAPGSLAPEAEGSLRLELSLSVESLTARSRGIECQNRLQQVKESRLCETSNGRGSQSDRSRRLGLALPRRRYL